MSLSVVTCRKQRRGTTTIAGGAGWVGSVVVIVLSWTVIAIGFATLIVRWRPLDWQPSIVIVTFFPYWVAVSCAGTIGFVTQQAWPPAAFGGVVFLIGILTLAPRLFRDHDDPSSGLDLVIMQANVWIGAADAESLVRKVADHSVDILTVNELTPAGVRSLDGAGITGLLPYRFLLPQPGGAGTGIWSRYPLGDTERDQRFSFETLTARVSLPGGPNVLLAAVHPQPPWPFPRAAWLRELEWLRHTFENEDAPVLMSGDFNATQDHGQFRRLLRGGFRDVASACGAGLVGTFPAQRRWFVPLVTLDHILTKGMTPMACRVVRLKGSDHCGLIARLRMPPS
jgi:endonuclease/exonuclease/phosphatase (EEP) superfamily protein YafD